MTIPTPTPGPSGVEGTAISIISVVAGILGIISGPAYRWWTEHRADKDQDQKHKLAQLTADVDIDSKQTLNMKLTLEAANQAVTNYNALLVRQSQQDDKIEAMSCEIQVLKNDRYRLENEKAILAHRVEVLEKGVADLTQQLKDAKIDPNFKLQ